MQIIFVFQLEIQRTSTRFNNKKLRDAIQMGFNNLLIYDMNDTNRYTSCFQKNITILLSYQDYYFNLLVPSWNHIILFSKLQFLKKNESYLLTFSNSFYFYSLKKI